jgi:vacuolar-type H+-ATPase subunit F/Vma7
MKFHILGDEDVLLGFQFIGIEGSLVETTDEAVDMFNKAIQGELGKIGVLIITEKINAMIHDTVMEWQLSGEYPLIVEVPDLNGHLEGRKTILQAIREAIGLQV